MRQTPRQAAAPETLKAFRKVGLRPTRQRVALADLIFAKGNRHLTAEGVEDEARDAGVPVSLATIYNTLRQFSRVGLLRQIAVDGQRTYFDTNTSSHHHFFVEEENRVIDVPPGTVTLKGSVDVPIGNREARIDIVIRLKASAR